jgi:hypothetical protein
VNVSVLICSPELVAVGGTSSSGGGGGAAADAGDSLRLSFQLRDVVGRTAVNLTGVVIRPLLVFASGSLPAGLNTTSNELPSCDVEAVGDLVSGIGECSVSVSPRFFPGAGTIDANVQVELHIG